MRSPARKLLDLLLEAPGFWLVRSNPAGAVTAELADLAVELRSDPDDETYGRFAPEVRSAARWLVGQDHLRLVDLDRIVASVRDFDEQVLALTLNALPRPTRETALTLSTVRAPCHANGGFGPLAWSDDPTPRGIPRDAVCLLEACGFLCAEVPWDTATLRMPRRVRDHLAPYARLRPSEGSNVHRAASEGDFERSPLSAQLEMHFHAVAARDVERALATARYHGAALKTLATALSKAEQWADAARVYEHLLAQFDRDDAFVWEYRVFNLARWDGAEGDSGRNDATIREGYEKADRLTKQLNPLYRGRLLGYRAERGDDIRAEFEAAFSGFLTQFGGDEDKAIAQFVEAVFDGLRRGRRVPELRGLIAKRRTAITRHAPEVFEKYGR